MLLHCNIYAIARGGKMGLLEEVIDGAVAFAYVVIGACYDGLADVFLCPFG